MNSPQTSPHLTLARAASRRDFLACGATAIVTTLIWPSGLLAAPSGFIMKELSLDEVRLATFARQLHTTFRITDAPAGDMELKLIEAKAAAPVGLDAHHEKFSLIFSGPKSPVLEQKIYRFEHPRIGWFAMFIVPIVTEATGQQHYQAIFNRPVLRNTNLT